MYQNVLSGVAVKNFAQAVIWYEKLLGRKPDSIPMNNVAEWKFPGGGWLQLFADEQRSGYSSVTLSVDDIKKAELKLGDMNIKISNTSDSSVVKTITIGDPDGNQIVFAEAVDNSIGQ